MSQHDYVIANGTGAAVRSDLNNALAAIVTQNSGATAPATTYAYQWWADTTTGLLKIRNAANNAWVTIGSLSTAGFGLLAAGDTLTAALGSASTPGITFTGDLNTGIYSPGADQVAISTNGSGRLFVDSSGRVGVGVASPGYPLDLVSQSGESIRIRGTSGTEVSKLLFTSNSAGTDYGWLSSASSYLAFGTAATERMRLTSTGLGIGTTAPAGKLHVNVASDTAAIFYSSGANVANIAALNDAGNSSRQLVLDGSPLAFNIASVEKARIDSSGRLLVGTSSYAGNGKLIAAGNTGGDAGAFDICWTGSRPTAANTDIGYIRWYSVDNSSGNAHYASIYASSDGASSSGSDIPGRLVFSTTADGASSPTERMRITSGGFLKASNTGTYINSSENIHEFITNNSNAYALRVHHNGTSGQQYGIEIKTANDQNDATRTFLDCFGGGAARIILRSNGGIANYSANNANLSDINTKKDISPAADTWDCIKEWEIVNYRYKDQPDDADLNLGVIAQQVAKSCPEVITVFSKAKEAKLAVLDDDGNQVEPAQEAQPEKLGVKEQQMYWMAIKALQEAQVRIEALEAEVAALKAQ